MLSIIAGTPRGAHRLIAFVCLCVAVATGRAETGAAILTFHIPAQPLESGLLEFAKQSGTRMFYGSALTEGLDTSGVEGDYPPDEALTRLLSSTGLAARRTETGAIALERLDPKAQLLAEARKPMPLAEAEPAPKPKQNDKGDTGELPEMTVTATPDTGYSAPNTTTATKTDTPIFDTPVSVQVVPRQVLDDQKPLNFRDAFENVSSVRAQPSLGNRNFFIIRGFRDSSLYRNGLRVDGRDYDTANLEALEVLKGPAAVLYGRIEPGG